MHAYMHEAQILNYGDKEPNSENVNAVNKVSVKKTGPFVSISQIKLTHTRPKQQQREQNA